MLSAASAMDVFTLIGWSSAKTLRVLQIISLSVALKEKYWYLETITQYSCFPVNLGLPYFGGL